MDQQNIEAQEIHAFDYMDDLLEAAIWSKGVVLIRTMRVQVYCYDVPMLRTALTELVTEVIKAKYKQCDINVSDVVDNIIDEYATDLRKHYIRPTSNIRVNRVQRTDS